MSMLSAEEQEAVKAFAGQIDSVEAYRPDDLFCDAIKGLNVFGADNGTQPLTDAQITQAIKFLSDLDFVPVE